MFLKNNGRVWKRSKRHWHLGYWLLLLTLISGSTVYASEHDLERLQFDRQLALEVSRTCEASNFVNLLRQGGLVPCLQEKTAAAVGHLCVTFQVFCLNRPWGAWLSQFLEVQPDLTDMVFDESGVSLLGESDGESWQVRSWPQGYNGVPKAVMLSNMRHMRESFHHNFLKSKSDKERAYLQDLLVDTDRTILEMEKNGPEIYKTPLMPLMENFSTFMRFLNQ